MNRWLLLTLTLVCAYATYQAFRMHENISRGPFSTIQHLWKDGLSHLSIAEKRDVQQNVSRLFAGKIGGLFLVATLYCAVATVRAFVS